MTNGSDHAGTEYHVLELGTRSSSREGIVSAPLLPTGTTSGGWSTGCVDAGVEVHVMSSNSGRLQGRCDACGSCAGRSGPIAEDILHLVFNVWLFGDLEMFSARLAGVNHCVRTEQQPADGPSPVMADAP